MATDTRPETRNAAQSADPLTLNIHLRFRPSTAFLGILAEMNAQFSDWTDGSYDWADQTADFLDTKKPLPDFGEALLRTSLSQSVLRDLLQLAIALLSGHYLAVRNYLQKSHFALVIGYPRSGGSYLTKELLRTVGLDHTRVSEALAHDGFPDMRDHWYIANRPKPYFHLQDAVLQVAEFLVIAHLYYRRKTVCRPDGTWLIPKKMHKLVHWAGSFKMLLGKGAADYLVTVRHPVPTAVSIYEKSGGLPSDGRFPAAKPRSAIELWIRDDLAWLGYSPDQVARMTYFRAVEISWTAFHARMASSGLFLGDREEIQLISYGQETLEGVVNRYRARYGSQQPAESFFIHDKASTTPAKCLVEGDAAVASVQALWRSLGLVFPSLSWF
jgi:hypothetical protein